MDAGSRIKSHYRHYQVSDDRKNESNYFKNFTIRDKCKNYREILAKS